MRTIGLCVLVAAFWLALSGHYGALIMFFGAASVAFTVFMAQRMRVNDEEGLPVQLFGGAVTYWPWLIWEIVKSAWAVSKIIIDPKLPISPTMTVVKAGQKSAAGVATFANSITLTPGTITTGADEDGMLTIHALTREGALDLEDGGMDARVKKFEGSA